MHVLENDESKPAACQTGELCDQPPQRLLSALLRGEIGYRVSPVCGDRQQCGDKRPRLIVDRWVNYRLKLRQSLFGGVVAFEAGGAFELSHYWVKWAVLMIRGAVKTHRRVIGQPVLEGAYQARLPDPRLARDQHDATFTRLDQPPAPQQQVKLFIASDQRG